MKLHKFIQVHLHPKTHSSNVHSQKHQSTHANPASSRRKTRLTAEGLAQSEKTSSIAIERFSKVNVFKNLALLLSRKYTLTHIDGKKIFINNNSFMKKLTDDKHLFNTLVQGTFKTHNKGFNKGELAQAVLKLKRTPAVKTAEKIEAIQLQVKVFKKQSRLSRLRSEKPKYTTHTYHIAQGKKHLKIDAIEVIGEGTYGMISSVRKGKVLKQTRDLPLKSHRKTNQVMSHEVAISKKIHSRFHEKYPEQMAIGLGGAEVKKIVEISLRLNDPSHKKGFMLTRRSKDLFETIKDQKKDPSNSLMQALANAENPVKNIDEIIKHPQLQKLKEDNLFMMYQLLKGLAILHEMNIAHRDIKPENIMVEGDRAYLIDFGGAQDLLRHGEIGIDGTKEFINRKEQLEHQKLDKSTPEGKMFLAKTDSLAMGLTLYELLTQGAQYYRSGSSGPLFSKINPLKPLFQKLYGDEIFDLLKNMVAPSHLERSQPNETLAAFMQITEQNPALMQRIEQLESQPKP